MFDSIADLINSVAVLTMTFHFNFYDAKRLCLIDDYRYYSCLQCASFSIVMLISSDACAVNN